MRYFYFALLAAFFGLGNIAAAAPHPQEKLISADDDVDWGTWVQQNIKKTWESENYDIYIPVNTWHNRLFYDRDKIDEYNEMPWGLGFGKSFYDDRGDWHSLYAMAFDDSNYHLQTIFGYAYQRNWYLDCDRDWRIGAGYTLSVTQRHEYKYVPLPLPLPLVGLGYKKFNLQAAYVPGVKNNGNVLFTWVRWELGD